MDVLVMLDERPDRAALLAHVNTVPSPLTAEFPHRGVVTMYGDASPESLAVALAAAVEGRQSDIDHRDATLVSTAQRLLTESGPEIRQLSAGLNMPDWPEGTRRAISFSLPTPVRFSGGMGSEAMLESLRELDGMTAELDEI
jgi:hypothetical protein